MGGSAFSAFSVRCELHFRLLCNEIRGSDCWYYNRFSSQQSKLPHTQQSSPRNSVWTFLPLVSTYFIILKHYIILHIGTAFRLNFLPQSSEPNWEFIPILHVYSMWGRCQLSGVIDSPTGHTAHTKCRWLSAHRLALKKTVSSQISPHCSYWTRHSTTAFSSRASHLPSAYKIWHALCTNADCETADSMFLGNAETTSHCCKFEKSPDMTNKITVTH
jgi:hypothetical protein